MRCASPPRAPGDGRPPASPIRRFGAISFLALEAIGGTITLNYGCSQRHRRHPGRRCHYLPLPACRSAYYAASYGIDMDLLTRGAGFGYIGSTITSLIYASFTFIFFALEAAIMALALELCFGIPPAWWLSHRAARHHSPGDLRHHLDQPLPAVDAAALGRAARAALRGDRLGQSAFVHGMAQIRRRTWRREWPSSICCCSARRHRWCFRWSRRSANRSTSCASCRATAEPLARHGGSHC